MIETSTQSPNDIANINDEPMSNDSIFDASEISFYNSIKADLNKLVMNPSDKSIIHILDFSRSI
jgi:hypothetical protein